MRAAEIDDLITLRDASSLLVAEAYMIVHHPQWHYAKELYDNGVIGTLWSVDKVITMQRTVVSATAPKLAGKLT